MQTANLLPLVLVLAVVAYGLAYMRSRAVAEPLGGIRNLKSLPFYYAARAALWSAIPALIVLALWASFEGKVIQNVVMGSLPADLAPQSEGQASLTLSQISNVAAGKLDTAMVPEGIAGAAGLLESLRAQSSQFKATLVLLITVLGAAFAWTRVMPHINARESVERT
ncbi:MAG TPA: phosphate ABC transporter permease family protein, partial [Marinobacter sp.]